MAHAPPNKPSEIPPNPIHVVLDNIRSAFNVGSIFRTSDAGNIEHLYLCGMTAHPPHPRLMRTGLGAEEQVAWSHHRPTMKAVELIEQQGIPLIAVEIGEAAINYHQYEWPSPVALVFGHETRGIAPEVAARCRATVRIPMFGHKNTINVASAYSIVLYEVLRQWGVLDQPMHGEQQRFLEP